MHVGIVHTLGSDSIDLSQQQFAEYQIRNRSSDQIDFAVARVGGILGDSTWLTDYANH